MKPKLHAVSTSASATSSDGNPFLTPIPDAKDDLQLVRRLGFNPFSDPRWQNRVVDPERLLNHLRMTFIPTPTTLRIAKKILGGIRNGYEARDPRFPAAWSSYFQSDSRVIYADIDPVTQDGIAIPGITGMGKTALIKRILGLMPRAIVHDRLGDHLVGVKQVVWLYVEMNTGRGLGALLYRLLNALDQTLETSQYAPLNLSKRSEDLGILEDRVLRALKTHFVGAVAIDEAQRVNLQEKDGSERTRNFLVQLMNTGIQVILLGSPKGLQFREKERQSAQLMGRMLEDPQNRLVPPESPDHEDWQILVRGLWQCQLMPERAPLTGELYDLLHRLTGGIPKTLATLLAESQKYALSLGHKLLSPPVILYAAANSPMLTALKPLIDGLVSKDAISLRVYSDVDHDRLGREWVPDDDSAVMETMPTTTKKQKSGEALAAEDRKRFKSDQTRRKRKADSKDGGTKATPLAKEYIAQLDAIMNRNEDDDD